MLDLFDEFVTLIGALEADGVEYAVCGGLAMAIHGLPRASIDVDLLVPSSSVDSVIEIGRRLGYTIPAEPMSFAKGAVEIRRVTKIDPSSHDLLRLNILIASPAMGQTWDTRLRVQWERGPVWVVSRQGLIALKRLRGSGQDQDDIKRLEMDVP